MSEIKLENRADLDILTQTLNINAFTEKARDFFSEGNQCMLAAVDLDNFSRINHHYGQLFGDMLICGIAEKLKRLLNESDIIGRAGGDEFLLLFGGIKNQDEALSRLNALKSLFEKPFQTETEKDMLSISAGIGAALFPEHGNSFDEVYTNTELALTHSKQLGHGVCALFDETMKSADKSHLSPQSVIGSTIDSKAEKSFSQNFIEHIFNILYNSKDINEAIPAVLSYTGSKFGVSHAYIFELSENKESYHKIFEWSAEEEKVEILKIISADEMTYEGLTYQSYFNNDNVFISNNVNELNPVVREVLSVQNIKATIQSALLEDGEFIGYIGFDECKNTREWTKNELRSLILVSRVLGVFYVNNRANFKLREKNEMITYLIDNVPTMAYIIDPDTYNILLYNKRTKAIFNDIKTGMKCYRVFKREYSPCDYCPIAEWKETGAAVETEFYNPYKDMWFDCTATSLNWYNTDETDNVLVKACMLSCFDITKYKKREALDLK